MLERFRRPTQAFVLGWARATLLANIVIVVTGAAVRLTASGLGCPTWPRCSDSSFVTHRELGGHGLIEFGNRLLTYALAAVVIATVVAVWRWTEKGDPRRVLSVAIALGVPLQAVIGGISVLTDLNPWVVALHLLLSLVLVAASLVLLWRVGGQTAAAVPTAATTLVRVTYAVLWAVLYVGTVVTGSGPHAGDADVPRNGLDPRAVSQLHADLVFLLIGASVGCVLMLRAVQAPRPVVRVAALLLVAELAQGALGFVQYFTDLPIVLVEVHVLGACVLVAVATRLTVGLRTDAGLPGGHGVQTRTGAFSP